MSESYDSTWYDYEEPVRYGDRLSTNLYRTHADRLVYKTTSPESKHLLYEAMRKLSYGSRQSFIDGPIKNYSDKEKSAMGSKYGLSYEDQEQIDEAVRAAIAKPLIDAEIANRTAAVTALGVEDSYEVGTVLTFKRKASKTVTYLHVALKQDEDTWLATGGRFTGSGGRAWNDLLTMMTTGEDMVFDVAVGAPGSLTPLTWTPAAIVPTQAAPADEKV